MNIKPLLVIGTVVLTGSLLLLSSYASAPRIALEAEGGTLTHGAIIKSDANAGGGKMVEFSSVGRQQARQADEFVDSIGVNTHMHYGTYSNTDQIRSALIELGIRHVRDYPVDVAALSDFGKSGIKTSAIIPHPGQAFASKFDFSFWWGGVEKLAPYLASIEGINEPDITFTDKTLWPQATRDHQKRIWETAKANPALRHIPIAGPSMTWASNTDELGDISAYADWGNQHPYPGGRTPDMRVREDMAASQKYNVNGKPVIMTETGYHNQVPSDTGHKGTSERADAIYMPRLYLHYFSLGIPRTYDYEFYDQGTSGAEHRFGWLRNDYSRKPVFYTMKNLIGLLSDRGAPFTPGSLSYEIAGGDAYTRSLLLQKRDGSFWLAVWQETSVSDPDSGNVLDPADRSVTLNLGKSVTAVNGYMPNRGAGLLWSGSGSSHNFTSSEEVTLLEIIGAQ